MAGSGHGASPIDPLHQFEIQVLQPLTLFGKNVAFTNAAMWMAIALSVLLFVFGIGVAKKALVPGRMQSLAEISHGFIANVIRENAGEQGMKYFPFIFSLFLFILACNVLGLVPYSFTVTSHIIVTLALGLLTIIVVTCIGFAKHGTHFLSLFVPSGVPAWLLPLLVPIEIISYLIRPFSLAVRLFANMVAGHMMLKVFAGFVIMLGFVGGWLPLIVMVGLFALELLVAFLQAYVFALLASIYLNDALHMHH